jgi:putative endonuclease
LSPRQRQRAARAAELFLLRRPDLAAHTLRFDLVAVRPWRLPRHLVDAWRVS